MSVHFSKHKGALVPRSVWEVHDSFSLNVVVHEFSLVDLACVCKVVFSISVELALYKVTFVVAAFEFEPACACLFTVVKLPCVFHVALVIPSFLAISVLDVILPLT